MKKDPSQEIQTSVLAKDSCCLFWLLHEVCEPQSGGGQLLKLKQNPEIKTEMVKMLEAADFAFLPSWTNLVFLHSYNTQQQAKTICRTITWSQIRRFT